MKVYFDDENIASNCNHLTSNGNNDYWIVAPGSSVRHIVKGLGKEISFVKNLDECGCYFVDVRGDPDWWAGVLTDPSVPTQHILELLPDHIKQLVKEKKLFIIIAADREGGSMFHNGDCFRTTTSAMRKLSFPAGSVLIMQGNKKIEKQYTEWLSKKKEDRLFDVMYSNHFSHIFINRFIPDSPLILQAIDNQNSADFNSLNRVYRTHRGAHLYKLAEDNLLDKGLVSANQINVDDEMAADLLNVNLKRYNNLTKQFFPRFIDGDWSIKNAANQYNSDIYKNSMMTVVTETIFLQDVAFITEKIWKPITMGHPLILFASVGTLQSLKELGFKITWCGIDPSYNDIVDDKERLQQTHNTLISWCKQSREEKIKRIRQSYDVIQHNFELIRKKDFYKEAVNEALNRAERYFYA